MIKNKPYEEKDILEDMLSEVTISIDRINEVINDPDTPEILRRGLIKKYKENN